MKYFGRLFLLFLINIPIAISFQAQQPSGDEKATLVSELIKAMRVEQRATAMVDMMLTDLEKTYPALLRSMTLQAVGGAGSSSDAIAADIEKSSASFMQRFRLRLLERIDYAKFTKDSLESIYSRTFTEKELRDLLEFHKSETGRKMLEVEPKIMEESLRLSNDVLLPQVTKIAEELLKEDLEKLKPPPPPAPKRKKP